MNVTHSFPLAAKCPSGLTVQDVYEVQVVTDRMIAVEDILAAADELANGEPIYQEDLTAALADRIGATVRTIGAHGVVTTTAEAVPA